jgi:chemotaxis protein CheZ
MSGSDNTGLGDDSRAQLGAIVRQLHDALQTLGYASSLQQVVQEIPDARERLSYVGQMTERAAHKVLTLVDEAKPGCRELEVEGLALLQQDVTSPDPLTAFAQKSVRLARAQQEALNSILLAQDFQDLSGQVIQKVVNIISRTEEQLCELLLHSAAPAADAAPPSGQALAGPQVPDKAMAQADVDDLLASMGF